MTSRSSSPTLRDPAGLSTDPTPLAQSTLVVIDAQVEYSSAGAIPLPDIDAAMVRVCELLAEARRRKVPIIHVAHTGPRGAPFDPKNGGRFLTGATPTAGEDVVTKTLPNAFARTTLRQRVEQLGRPLVICGFMTHMCVASTARAALDLGLDTNVVADATATRSLRSPITHPKEYAMSNKITVKSAPAVVVAAHRTATTDAQVFDDIPAGFATVMAALSKAGIGPIGIPFTLYHQAPDGDTAGDIAMCVPIPTTIHDAADGVETIALVAETAASVIHQGSYDDIGESYAEIVRWIQERGHRIAGPTREVYLNSPAEVANDDLLTEIHFPIDAQGERR